MRQMECANLAIETFGCKAVRAIRTQKQCPKRDDSLTAFVCSDMSRN